MNFDTIVVGAGLAGASVAFQLSRHQKVLLIESARPASGASGVAGGLFSPMIALRGRPVWQIDEAIDAFHEQLQLANATELFDSRGVLRPAKDEQQVIVFKQSVEMCPLHADWLPAATVYERFPKVQAPLGALFAKTGGAISTSAFTQAMVQASIAEGASYLENTQVVHWGEADGSAFVEVLQNNARERVKAQKVVLAIGKSFFHEPSLTNLDLHAVKGQTIRVQRPSSLLFEDFPPISGRSYIIPEKDTLAIGSSFSHTFEDELASPEISEGLLQKASSLLPQLSGTNILETHVGIRVTVPKIRLPMVGALPEKSHIWVFTAFGSKGLLLAPLLACRLLKYFEQPDQIPKETQVRVKT